MTEEITGKDHFNFSNDEIDKFKKHIQESEKKSYSGKVRLLNKLLRKGIITPQFADLLRHIHTSTAGYQEGATLRKINIILALRNKLLAEEISGKRIAYIGSGDDWRFAVALGARNIDMIDPLFTQEEERHKLFDDIKNVDPRASLQEDTPTPEVVFHIDLGGRPEKVKLSLHGKYGEDYIPEEKLGGIIEYLGPTQFFLVQPQVARHLEPGAIIANFNFSLSFKEDYEEKGVRVIKGGDYHVFQLTNSSAFLSWVQELQNVNIPKNPNQQ